MKSEVNSLAQKVSEELSKYTYFLLAASGSSIAYALNQSADKVIIKEFTLIIALLAWCGSFYFGIHHLHLHRTHMIENAKALMMEEPFEQAYVRLEPFMIRMERASNLQYYFFITGVLFYITWRIF